MSASASVASTGSSSPGQGHGLQEGLGRVGHREGLEGPDELLDAGGRVEVLGHGAQGTRSSRAGSRSLSSLSYWSVWMASKSSRSTTCQPHRSNIRSRVSWVKNRRWVLSSSPRSVGLHRPAQQPQAQVEVGHVGHRHHQRRLAVLQRPRRQGGQQSLGCVRCSMTSRSMRAPTSPSVVEGGLHHVQVGEVALGGARCRPRASSSTATGWSSRPW